MGQEQEDSAGTTAPQHNITPHQVRAVALQPTMAQSGRPGTQEVR